MKKAWISLLALVLAIAYPFTALAATWDNVNTAEKLKEAFADTDAAGVIINLSGDIDLYRALEALEGQTYVINGTTYVLANVSLKGGGKGGSVTINGDVVGKEDNEALRVDDEVHVTVNGNVDASASDNYNGVDAQGNAQVTVNGNVSTKNDDAVEAKDNSQVTVTGDVLRSRAGVSMPGITRKSRSAEASVPGKKVSMRRVTPRSRSRAMSLAAAATRTKWIWTILPGIRTAMTLCRRRIMHRSASAAMQRVATDTATMVTAAMVCRPMIAPRSRSAAMPWAAM